METTALGYPRMGGRPAAYVLEPVEVHAVFPAGPRWGLPGPKLFSDSVCHRRCPRNYPYEDTSGE